MAFLGDPNNSNPGQGVQRRAQQFYQERETSPNGNPGTANNTSFNQQYKPGQSPSPGGGPNTAISDYAIRNGGQQPFLSRYVAPQLDMAGNPVQRDQGGYAYNLPNAAGPYPEFAQNYGRMPQFNSPFNPNSQMARMQAAFQQFRNRGNTRPGQGGGMPQGGHSGGYATPLGSSYEDYQRNWRRADRDPNMMGDMSMQPGRDTPYSREQWEERRRAHQQLGENNEYAVHRANAQMNNPGAYGEPNRAELDRMFSQLFGQAQAPNFQGPGAGMNPFNSGMGPQPPRPNSFKPGQYSKPPAFMPNPNPDGNINPPPMFAPGGV